MLLILSLGTRWFGIALSFVALMLCACQRPAVVSGSLVPVEARQDVPDFGGTTIAGIPARFSRAEYAGKVVALSMFRSICEECLRDRPWMAGLYKAYRRRGFDVVELHLGGGNDSYRSADYRVLAVGENFTYSFGGLTAVPSVILVDRQGRMAFWSIGSVSRGAVEAGILALLDHGR